MRLGPVFRYERTRSARRPAFYVSRVVVGMALPCAAWTVAGMAFDLLGGGPLVIERPQDLSATAEVAFAALTWIQGLFLLLALPAVMGGSIAEQDRRGTMLEWLASPLSGGDIVLGTLAARLLPIALCLGTVLPLILPLVWLGVLDAVVVGLAYGLLAALGLCVASLALLVSVVVRRPRLAMFTSYVLVGGWLLLPFYLSSFSGIPGRLFSGLQALNDAVMWSHPGPAAWYLSVVSLALRAREPAAALWASQALRSRFPWVLGAQLAASLLFLLLASIALRPLRIGRKRSGLPTIPHPGWLRGVARLGTPAVGDDPMLWKELNASGSPAPRWARLAAGVLGALLFCTLLGPATRAFEEWRQETESVGQRRELNRALRQISACLSVVGLACVAAAGATSVTGERERGTWIGLTMTTITASEIARAKVAGTLWGQRGLAAPFLILWTVGLVTGSVHPVGALASAAGLLIFAWAAAALGVLVSSVSITSERALTATFLALLIGNTLALSFVPLSLVGSLAGSRQGLFLAGIAPFMEWVALTSPTELQAVREGWAWDERLTLPFGLWSTQVQLRPALIRTFALSLILHATSAAAAMRAAAWMLHPRRLARPGRVRA